MTKSQDSKTNAYFQKKAPVQFQENRWRGFHAEGGGGIWILTPLINSSHPFKMGCCQLQAKVCGRSTGKLLVQACPGKSVVR